MGNIVDARGFFRANVSDEILASIVKKIQGANRDAARRICELVKEGVYNKYVARDLFPLNRRATIETRLFDLADDYSNVLVTTQRNKTLSNYHTRIQVGKVIMTASAVETPFALVREADFRNNYAGPQLRLFDLDSKNNISIPEIVIDPSSDDFLYAVILYCPSGKNRFEIGSVGVGIPNDICTRYRDKIDLTRLFPETTKKTQIEQIEDQAFVNLLLDEEELFSRGEEQEEGEEEEQEPDERI